MAMNSLLTVSLYNSTRYAGVTTCTIFRSSYISLIPQNMFNLTAARALRARFNASFAFDSDSGGTDDDIAALLRIPGLDALDLWKMTAHSRSKIVKEVSEEAEKVDSSDLV